MKQMSATEELLAGPSRDTSNGPKIRGTRASIPMMSAHAEFPFANTRAPYPSELDFFKKNADVAGYAAEDDSVVLNPFARLTPEGAKATVINESARIFMKKAKMAPSFALTEEQIRRFKDYSDDIQDIRETIAARILAKDPSAGSYTKEQLQFVEKLRAAMGKKKKK